ncbi:MAG: pyridoxal-phosphate dependent enzyme [Gammaproteobacteria bacterium]
MNRVLLSEWPTPLLPAGRLGAAIGVPQLLIKHDDRSGTVYGGNKVRKLEYLLADARAQGCDAVMTYGAAGSNHALATAIYARQLGLHCYCVLVDQADTPWIANTLRWHAHIGTTVAAAAEFAGVRAAAAALRDAHPTGADRIYDIAWGGSSPTGSLGFVGAGAELARQMKSVAPGRPVRIYIPCGTMGSTAGLMVGLANTRLTATVVGVKVVPQNSVTAAAVLQAAEAVQALLPATQRVPETEIAARLEFRGEFAGEGYAVPTEASLQAVSLAGSLENCRLDTTYAGKAFACLIDDARNDRLSGALPVFWHTWNTRPYPDNLQAVDTTRLPAAFQKYFH